MAANGGTGSSLSRDNFRNATILVDFENVFYWLKNNRPGHEAVTEAIARVIRGLRQHLLTEYQEQTISMDAYADFDRIGENALSELYLLGIDTHNVLGTDHKNAADMRLCIDAVDIFHVRRDISTFVFLAGDRDYLPVIQYLRKRGRTVRVVGWPRSVSGDLVTIVGREYFIDATMFLPAAPGEIRGARQGGPAARAHALRAESAGVHPPPGPAVPPRLQEAPAPGAAPVAPAFREEPEDEHEDGHYEELALDIIFKHFAGKPEIWLTPYLHKLRAEMPELTEPERKRIISRLQEEEVFRVEKRSGTPNDYSVIMLNWN
ncbi:MAG TPA: NYN domain-containing protein, partial [Beijerinckiaceae bacterium]|nr:NYN domain-containing protein [Beijerinckiaceae bacterium]